MDWNWFFSTFSQSAAALLGIIGAFTISKLIGIDEKSFIFKSDFEDLIIAYQKIKNSFSVRKYKWINRTFIFYNDDIAKQIQNREFEGLTEREILDKLYQQDSRLYKNDESVLNAFNELYEEFKPKEEVKRQIGKIYVETKSFRIPKIPPEGIWNRIGDERDLINQQLINSAELIAKFCKHSENIQSFNGGLNIIKIIVWILIISFPLTVIYPLHFLPMEVGEQPYLTFNLIQIFKNAISIRNVLLTIFLLSVEGIFVYFLYRIEQIKKMLQGIQESHLVEYRDINSYCNYYNE